MNCSVSIDICGENHNLDSEGLTYVGLDHMAALYVYSLVHCAAGRHCQYSLILPLALGYLSDLVGGHKFLQYSSLLQHQLL